MKKQLLAILFSICSLALQAQIINTTNGGYISGDRIPVSNNPAICDTLHYVFSLFLDSVKRYSNGPIQIQNDTDTSKSFTVSTADRPRTDVDRMYNGEHDAYYCPYMSGKDSATMFKVFNNLIGNVKECLLNGTVKEMDVLNMRDYDNPRTIRYGYFVKEIKPGTDPKMKTVSILVEFKPDQTGIQTDNFTLYRVNMIIHPR